jgi:hypothetical protein
MLADLQVDWTVSAVITSLLVDVKISTMWRLDDDTMRYMWLVFWTLSIIFIFRHPS